MLGVRFGAVCTIVVGGMLVFSAAHAAQTCDARFPRTCKAAAQSNREAPKATSAQRTATATRTRTRRVARRHSVQHAQSARPARRTAEKSEAPPLVHAQEPSPAARRFSEFVSPRLLAANPVEELHKPRMNVAEFSGHMAYPVADGIDQESNGASVAPARPESRDAPGEIDPAEPVRAQSRQIPAVTPADPGAQLSASPVSRAERDSSENSTPWVRIVFLTWGGLLTLGSALRLLIG